MDWPICKLQVCEFVLIEFAHLADYAHHITASPPGFEIPAASLSKDAVIK